MKELKIKLIELNKKSGVVACLNYLTSVGHSKEWSLMILNDLFDNTFNKPSYENNLKFEFDF
jgi:hypothetical protein